MPRYFMHLRDGIDEVLDSDGIEMPAEAVPGAALASARGCIAGDVHSGRIELKPRIDVHDEEGALVQTIRFADAIVIVPE